MPGSHETYRRPLVALAQFCLVLGLLWCIFFAIFAAFPYIRSGAEAIYRAKTSLLQHGLNADTVIFGNSKTLSGFRPASFDALTGLHSFNLGLPDEERFIANLEALASHGKAPRIALLTLTRSAPEHPASMFRYLEDDRAIVDRLFPFRHLPRDLTLFLLRSRARGGPAAFYRQSEGIVAQMEANRGYYFIEAQAVGPDHRLPESFHLPSDRPDFVNARSPLSARDLSRLLALTGSGMQIWWVPTYYRPGEYAPAPAENPELAAMAGSHPELHLAGPDYWILPLQYFSDPSHLNPEGAEQYTRRLAELLKPLMK